MDVTRKSARKWIDSLSLRVQQALFAAAAYLILLAICLLAISPEQYDLSVGDVAPKTITASKDIVDEITTERRRQAAADAVSPVYYKDDTVSDTVLSDMDAVFSELRAVRELGEQIRNAWGDEGGSFTEADYAQASGLVTRLSLSNYQLRTLMNTGESDFESLGFYEMPQTGRTEGSDRFDHFRGQFHLLVELLFAHRRIQLIHLSSPPCR